MRRPSPKPRRRRVRRLPPTDVPRQFFALFGELDPEKAKAVARFVDCDNRRSGIRTDVLLLHIGSKEGIGFSSRSRGFDYLRAGRYLLNKEDVWRKTTSPRRSPRR